MADGSTIEVGMIGSEGIVGVAALLGRSASTQQVIIQVPGCALRMKAVECRAIFDQSPAVRAVMLGYLAALFDLASQTAACNRFTPLSSVAPGGC
jgi:CRP-like cAMP-binding protein